MNATAFGFGTPFYEQLEFFRNKLNLPTERWDDIQKSAHDRAFIVAGAQKADLLADLNGAVRKAIEQGTGYAVFHRDFKAIVARHGWIGWTGEGSKEGEAWRSKVIYQTNLTTSYAAGRYRQLTDPDLLKLRPYWRYVHADWVANPRQQHVAWNGLTLRHDHPFWKTHYPPNGWGCHCTVRPVDAREYEQSQTADKARPPEGWDEIDPKTGVPKGIAKGFDYAPGASTNVPLRQFVQEKLINYPEAISSALSRDVTRYVNATENVAAFAARAVSDRGIKEPLWLGFIDSPAQVSEVAGADVKGYLILLPAEAPRHVERSHGNDGGNQRPAFPDDYRQIAAVLNEADRLEQGATGRHGQSTVIAWKKVGDELFRAVFEVQTGKRNRSLALLSLVIKKKMGGG